MYLPTWALFGELKLKFLWAQFDERMKLAALYT